MAIAYRSASTPIYGNRSGGFTATEPTGATSGDLLIAQVVQGSGAGSAPTPPTGWTTLYSGLTAAGGASHFYYLIAYVVRGASAPSLVFGTSGTSAWLEFNCLCFSGVDNTTPIDSSANGTPVNAANPDPPSTTAVSSAAMAVCFGAQWNGSTTSWTPPTGYTRASRNNAGDDSTVAYKLLAASGAENPSAWSGGSGTNDCWAATVTLAPAGATNATVTAVPVAITVAVPAPAASGSSAGTVNAAPIAITAAVPAPVVGGSRTVTAAPIAITATIPAPAGFSSEVAAAPVAITAAIPAPAVSNSSTGNVSATPVAITAAVPAPTVSAAATVTAAPVAVTTALPAPTVAGNATVGAPALAITVAVPAPAISPAPVIVQGARIMVLGIGN